MNPYTEQEALPSTDGVRLVVLERPSPNGAGGPVLLIAHATGFHARVYDPMLATWDRAHLIAADLRGHGDALVPAGLDFAWQSFVDDLEAIKKAKSGDQQLLGFGHSMGGACLLMLELRCPGTFAGLYCYEPVVYPPAAATSERRASTWIERTLRRRAEFPSRESAILNYAGKPPYQSWDRRALECFVDHGFHRESDGSLHIKCRPETEAACYRMGPNHDTWEHLAELDCPVTIGRGGRGEPGPSAWAEDISRRIPGATFEEFDGLGHLGPMEDPERVAGAVALRLAGVSSGMGGQ